MVQQWKFTLAITAQVLLLHYKLYHVLIYYLVPVYYFIRHQNNDALFKNLTKILDLVGKARQKNHLVNWPSFVQIKWRIINLIPVLTCGISSASGSNVIKLFKGAAK